MVPHWLDPQPTLPLVLLGTSELPIIQAYEALDPRSRDPELLALTPTCDEVLVL